MDFVNTWIVGLGFIISGIFAKQKFTDKINNMSGYRTSRSKSSKEAWIFANKLSGNMYILGGIVGIILANLISIFVTTNIYTLIFVSLLAGLCFQLLTEFILRRTFDKNGKRKRQ